MAAEQQLTPEVLWAQRSSSQDPEKNFIYLTISVPDVPKENLKLDVKDQSIVFTGRSDSLKKTYHLDLELYGVIDPAQTKTHHTGMNIELKLQKKELKEEYWPRLLKEPKKMHFLKTDFDKWVDEDEQNEAADDEFNQFGGMGGMPGMGGMGGNDFGNLDFSKLGGGGMPGMPGMGEEEEDEDDEDMPPLEGEDEDDKAAPADSKAAETKAAATS